MEFFGLADKTHLRALNGVFVIVGMNRAIQVNIKNNHDGYLENLMTGFLTSGISVFLGAISLIIFLNFKDSAYVISIAENMWMANATTPLHLGMAIIIEGLGSSMIFSFISMQYLKDVRGNLTPMKKGSSKHIETENI